MKTDPLTARNKLLAGQALPEARFDVTAAPCKLRDLLSPHGQGQRR